MLRVTNIKAGNIVHGGLELKPRNPLFREGRRYLRVFLLVSSSRTRRMRRTNFRDERGDRRDGDKSAGKFISDNGERDRGWKGNVK